MYFTKYEKFSCDFSFIPEKIPWRHEEVRILITAGIEILRFLSRLLGDYTIGSDPKQCAVKAQKSPLISAIYRKKKPFHAGNDRHSSRIESPQRNRRKMFVQNRTSPTLVKKELKQRYVTHLERQ